MIGVTLQNVPPGNTTKKRAQISEHEMEEFKNEQKEFEKELKSKKSRYIETVEAHLDCLHTVREDAVSTDDVDKTTGRDHLIDTTILESLTDDVCPCN